MLRTRVWRGSSWVDELRERWIEIQREDRRATPFQAYEWHRLWMRHLGRFKEPIVWTAWEGDDLVGLMPFAKSSGLWRALRPMACGPSDYLQPLSRPGAETSVALLLAADLTGDGDCGRALCAECDLIDLHQVRQSEPLAAALELTSKRVGTVRLEQATCLALDLPSDYDSYLASLGKSLRYDVRRLDKLAGSGKVRVSDVAGSDAGAAMSLFFDLHARRWRARRLPGAFLGKRIRSFHLAWAEAAAAIDCLRLSVLSVDGEPAGVIYALAMHDTAYFYQSGFDPANRSLSPGTLMVAHSIRRAIGEGRRHFDFMRGDEPYKRRWMPQRSESNLRFILRAPGPLGRMALRWNGAGFRIEAKLRTRLEGKSLV
jgi:CelD/BcsL family acetyltransferase involved in cellulose biosynthesis